MKTCAFCGGSMEWMRPSRRKVAKFCCRACMAKSFTGRPSDRPLNNHTAHYRSRRMIPPGPCQKCGNPKGIDVHHIDGNGLNNDPANLERICRSCHMKEHRFATHCPKGHEFTEANTYINPRTGSRTCRRCRSDGMKAAYYRKTGQLERLTALLEDVNRP